MKQYTIQQLATMAGVSVRTLHYYDEIGLLTPSRVEKNGYRSYGERELLLLQQILLFKEMDFSLGEITTIISSPNFDIEDALVRQKDIITEKRDRLNRLLQTIDETRMTIDNNNPMNTDNVYHNFDQTTINKYTAEARRRWGTSDAWRQSEENLKKMGKEGLGRAVTEQGRITQEIATAMENGKEVSSRYVQKLIGQHYNSLRAFYEPNPQMYRGLARMYLADRRFTRFYEDIAEGLAQFMSEAMEVYADNLLVKE